MHIKNPLSLINFVAAYGTHASITSVDDIGSQARRRNALSARSQDLNHDGDKTDPGEAAPSDRLDFLNHATPMPVGPSAASTMSDLWMAVLPSPKTNSGLPGRNVQFHLRIPDGASANGDRLYYLSRTQA